MTNKTPYQCVKELHERFDLTPDTFDPQHLEWKGMVTANMNVIQEEIDELEDALESGDMAHILKEANDALYTILGLLVRLKGVGDPQEGSFLNVHESNMSKLDDDGNPIFNDAGKFIKGPNFRKADMRPFIG